MAWRRLAVSCHETASTGLGYRRKNKDLAVGGWEVDHKSKENQQASEYICPAHKARDGLAVDRMDGKLHPDTNFQPTNKNMHPHT